MKTAGIIAEYNPFHNGHKFQIDELRRTTGADYVIAIMSGNFVQRGTPALLDKYTRTRMALLGGVDLVLELPAVYATASAELFAAGGVKSLNATGICDLLCFGVESADHDLGEQIASFLADPAPAYDEVLAASLKKGLSYPAAREQALLAALPDVSAEELHNYLNAPNNILGLEYRKALITIGSSMEAAPILRKGAGYHDPETENGLASATAVRALLKDNCAGLASVVPDTTAEILCSAFKENRFLYEDSLTYPLGLKLMELSHRLYKEETLPPYADCGDVLLGRILSQSTLPCSYADLCERVKNKSVTHTHVTRALLHILLNYRNDLMEQVRSESAPYLRVLGFRKEAAPLLSALGKQAACPVITRPGAEVKQLNGPAKDVFALDYLAGDLYRQMVYQKCGAVIPNDFTQPMIRI